MATAYRFSGREMGRGPLGSPSFAGLFWGDEDSTDAQNVRALMRRLGVHLGRVDYFDDSTEPHRCLMATAGSRRWLIDLIHQPDRDNLGKPERIGAKMLRVTPLSRNDLGPYRPDESRSICYVGFETIADYIAAVESDDPTLRRTPTSQAATEQIDIVGGGRLDHVVGWVKRLPDGGIMYVYELVSVLNLDE